MSMTVEDRKAANKALIDEVLKAYPEKMAKRRAKHKDRRVPERGPGQNHKGDGFEHDSSVGFSPRVKKFNYKNTGHR